MEAGWKTSRSCSAKAANPCFSGLGKLGQTGKERQDWLEGLLLRNANMVRVRCHFSNHASFGERCVINPSTLDRKIMKKEIRKIRISFLLLFPICSDLHIENSRLRRNSATAK